ncbi:MAG TPA: response regulator [Candidatus Limnocylindrales bacterium]|nr:response regulator [Candidatus Limnocylindrales bacterium]
MADLVSFLQNAVAVAFVALGAVTAVTWLRRRDRSMGFLALAIILLASVTSLGRLAAYMRLGTPVLSGIEVIAFLGSAYALLLYRDALIPLPRRWHAAAIASLVAASVLILGALLFSLSRSMLLFVAVVFVLAWCACVGEPIVRFWLVSRSLPAVQAWRLRSLSLGFGGLVLLLLFAVSVGLVVRQLAVQVGIELVALAIVPLLYASFAPPAWLRRQWRAQEEESVRAFMEEVLVSDDRETLANRALELATRLVGGASAVVFDPSGGAAISRGMDAARLGQLTGMVHDLRVGISRITLDGAEVSAITVPIKGLNESRTMVVLAGPFTPTFGGDETVRMEQLMSAFVTALDRRRLVVELEHSNVALKEANRHKSVFLANMSHELRTPLNAIIGFSELLSDAREGQFDATTQKRFQNQILTSGKHLLSLINDILDLSKVEAGQMELRLQLVSVSDAVDQVIKTIEPLVAKKSLTMTSNVSGAGEVLADAGKLRQMLLNLVSNAIKFTPEGGVVTIGALRLGDIVEISVADTGIGIAEPDQAQIFQEFHQVDQGPGRKHEGTGLGLALTRRFALLHGGDVRVTSRVNKGSVFTLTLPVRAPAAAPAHATAPSTNGHLPDGPGQLVLVIEDDPAAAELLTRQLAEAGYRTQVARTGSEGLARARELQPAAITLDIILPEVDGWEIMTRLKSDHLTSGIPIVVVSVVDNPELGLALGAIDYFVKPIDVRLLIQRLNHFGLNPTSGSHAPRVLVVDDEAANRTWLTKALEPAGFTVLTAEGGREGIELAKSQRPDFVVLDLMMPEVTGFDVVEALRADESTRETPIMVLTATNLTEADKRLLNGRVSEILKRGSVGSSDIVGLVKRVVAHRNGTK